MTPRVARITTCLATLIATAAIGTPSALAIPRGSWETNHPLFVGAATQASPTLAGQPQNLPPNDGIGAVVPARVRVVSQRSGFSWSAAGIGALAAAAACAVAMGLVLANGRRRDPTVV